MTPRERVLRAVHRQTPDRVPKEMGFTPAAYDRFVKETGHTDPAEYFGMECRYVGFRPPRELPDFTPYLQKLPPGSCISSEYGTAHIPGTFYHFTRYVFPLESATTLRELEEYPWPDFTPSYRYEHLEAEVQAWHEKGYFVAGFAGHIFETAWQLIGFERTFRDFIENPEFVEWVLEKITQDNCFKARRLAEAGVDMVQFGDDVGMQDRLMMRPEVWRRFLKPRLAREIAAAREVRPNIPVWYHSDGNIADIIEDLIEVGVTVLNPVQPECLDMDWVKRRFGGRLAFWGTIGTQTVMPFGKPEDVKRAVKEMIDRFAPGLVLAPTHVIEPDVPWENILAFFEAVEEYGRLSP
ncbi:MAG: uroporphyrinogen decarboxylase family protein [Armatimonadota bacterium]